MKSAINFVRGAVAKNEAIPILTHIHVYDGRCQASNGRIVIDAPAPKLTGFNFTCPVKEFMLAIDNCDGEPDLSAKDGKLTVKSGKFKASLSMLPEEYPVMSANRAGAADIEIKILPVLRLLQPFISTDSNRPWSCGIFFDGNHAYATNNVVMLTTPCDDIGTINLSSACVDELLRIGEEPVAMLPEENSIIFFYDNGAWLKAMTLSTNWPDVSAFIPQSIEGIAITDEIKRDITRVAAFTDKNDQIHFGSHGISTQNEETIVEDYDFPESWFKGVHLCNVIRTATEIDFAKYPKPCPFIGENIKGVIIGCLP